VGLPLAPVPVDIAATTTREVRIETVFRYAHQYDRAIALMASGKVGRNPPISGTFPFFPMRLPSLIARSRRARQMSRFRSACAESMTDCLRLHQALGSACGC